MSGPREVAVGLRIQTQIREARADLDAIADRLDRIGTAGKSAGADTGAGLQAIDRAARDAKRAVTDASSNVDRLAQAVNAAAGAGTGQSPFIAALREQMALYGKSTDEVLRYRAAQAGVAAEAAPLILQFQNMRAAQQAAAAAAQEEAAAQRQAAAARQAAAQQSEAFIASLREQVALQGKSSSDVLRYRAGQLGVGSQAEEYIAAIEAFDKASGRGAAGLNRFGVSAAQTQAAMRMLPAQITDITTSLASGMPVWMVAIQQGGQIKDSFGGWAAAGNALIGVLNPANIAVAALAVTVGASAVAVVQAEAEQQAYGLAVQSTGNYAGVTRGQLDAMAEAAARSGGISRGAAREIATQMVASGRVGGQVIQRLTKLVDDYAAVTGQELPRAGAALQKAFEDPAKGAAELNRQFHFLAPAQAAYIRQLIEQGREEEARIELADRLGDRLNGIADRNLGTLQRAWRTVAVEAKNAWDRMLDIGREDTVEKRLEQQQRAVAQQAAALAAGVPGAAERLATAQRVLRDLSIEQRDATVRAGNRGVAARAQQAEDERRQELEKRLKSLAETMQTGREKIEGEKKLLDEALRLNVIGQEQYDKLLAAAQKRYADKPKANPVQDAFASQELALTQQLAEARQKLDNEQRDVGSSQGSATAKLEAWLSTSSKGLKLDAARVQTLRDLARQIDAVNGLASELDDGKKRDQRVAQGMADVEAQLAQAGGRGADAAVAEVQRRFAKLREDLLDSGNVEGLIKLDKLVDLAGARAQLEELRRQVDQVFAAQSREQQQLQAEMAAGVTSEYSGRQRLLELNTRTADQVQALVPRMRELAAVTGDPQLAAGVADLEARLGQLRLRTDDMKLAFQDAFQGGLAESIASLANGTDSLAEAARNLVRSIGEAMVNFASQKLAEQATGALMGGLDGALTAARALIPTFAQVSAAKVAADTTMTASGVAATTAAASAATVAGAEVAAANAPAAAATATWSFGAAAAAGLAALAAIYAFARGFATGGHIRGPGTGTSDSIPIWASNDEFVTRAAVVRQPGALQFLEDFNARGMRALALPNVAPGYATGGLVAAPAAASLSAYQPATPPVNVRGGDVALRVVNVLDPSLVDEWATSSSGERTLLNFIRRNRGAVKRELD